MHLAFIETTAFTRQVTQLGLEPGLVALQAELRRDPERGVLDPGTGGLRKIRMPDAMRGKGKRAGARVHYLYLPEVAVVYLLFVYNKGERATLSATDKMSLRSVVQQIRAAHHAQSRPR